MDKSHTYMHKICADSNHLIDCGAKRKSPTGKHNTGNSSTSLKNNDNHMSVLNSVYLKKAGKRQPYANKQDSLNISHTDARDIIGELEAKRAI